ncbi:MAG: hypothetical protein QOD77_279 [Thermoplasmata archaeon]|jgi:hypothetical protein|nr:hypothetical protein [Thermoplasmata archaeon]
MATPILQAGATVTCPHGATVSITPTNTSVLANGALLLVSDTSTVAGCPFQIPVGAGTKPSPCVTVQWTSEAQKTKVNGTGVLLQTSVGLCKSPEGAPQGSAIIATTQMRAGGS